MSNLEELYNEAGIKKTSVSSKIKPGILKVLVYMTVLGVIFYWSFSTSIFGSSKYQPYYFFIIAAVVFFVIMKKVSFFWKTIKLNKKFIKPD